MKKLLIPAVLGLGLTASATSNAAILDAWQLDLTSVGGPVTTNIGHLTLGGGSASVHVDTNGAALAAGQAFDELGFILSLTYTPNTVVGLGDTGLAILPRSLTLEFSGLSGFLDSVTATDVNFSYTPGVGTVQLKDTATSTVLANFAIATPSTGQQELAGGGGFAPDGTNDILGLVLSAGYTAGLFKDSTGTSLDANVLASTLFAAVHTKNLLVSQTTLGDGDLQLGFTSEGSFDLATVTVPEPGSIALIGLGLLAFGFANKSTKSRMVA